jgi:hypothetical protein
MEAMLARRMHLMRVHAPAAAARGASMRMHAVARASMLHAEAMIEGLPPALWVFVDYIVATHVACVGLRVLKSAAGSLRYH